VSERGPDCVPGDYQPNWGRTHSTAPSPPGGLLTRNKIQNALAAGRSNLMVKLLSAPPRLLNSGEPIARPDETRGAIYHIRSGWACQFHDRVCGRRAIVDIFLPGDVIGLDAALRTRPLEGVQTLTSVTIAVIPEKDALLDLMACQATALYIAWLLGQRQRRADQLLISVLSLDARGRLATMLLGFYTRLRRRKLIAGPTYNLPLTQGQIGSYLGLTVVHVNRVLRSLRAERIVHVERHCVTILDLDRLRSLAQNEAVEPSLPETIERPANGLALSGREAAD
jgi:CRP/FNR family transcriptional regulator, anaerobic regulatory protein